jgi:hypothetical protein
MDYGHKHGLSTRIPCTLGHAFRRAGYSKVVNSVVLRGYIMSREQLDSDPTLSEVRTLNLGMSQEERVGTTERE